MNFEKRIFFALVLSFGLILNLSFAAEAQKVEPQTSQTPAENQLKPIEVLDHRLDSKLMARPMPYRVIFPTDYFSRRTRSYPVLYLLHGLTGRFDNWTDKTKIVEYARKYDLIVVMPEGGNGWYTDSETENKDRYESYIVGELIPEIDEKFRTVADRNHRFIAGLSMGGYGSIKFGLKYPQTFSLVGSFSGALGAADWTEKEIGTKGAIAESILKVYGAGGSKTRRENDIFRMIRDFSPEKIKNLPFIYLDCGTEDFLIRNNLDFAALLREKKVPHEFRALPGKHDWAYWDAQVQEFLRLSEKFVNSLPAVAGNQFDDNESFCTETRLNIPITLEAMEALPAGLKFPQTLNASPSPQVVTKPKDF